MPQNTSQLKNIGRITSLSLGDGGKGKTYFAGTIEDYGKPYVIDAEGGLTTLANRSIDFDTVSSWKEFLDQCAWYFNNYEKEGYTHLVVDSITRLQQYRCLELNKDGKLTQSQWGEVLADVRKVIDRLTKACPTSVHVTAMAMEAKDELTGATKVFPNLQGAMKFDLAGYFDVVLYHHSGEKDGKQTHWVQTQGDQRIPARSRLDSIKPLKKYELNNYGILADIVGGNNDN